MDYPTLKTANYAEDDFVIEARQAANVWLRVLGSAMPTDGRDAFVAQREACALGADLVAGRRSQTVIQLNDALLPDLIAAFYEFLLHETVLSEVFGISYWSKNLSLPGSMALVA